MTRECCFTKDLYSNSSSKNEHKMKFKFLGGAGEVGKIGALLEIEGKRLMFDYGMAPGKPPSFPEPSPRVEEVYLTHAHLDHSGATPWISREYSIPVLGTLVTKEVSEVLLKDACKVAELEGYSLPYDSDDIIELMGNWIELRQEKKRLLGNLSNITVTPYPAGHIPGAMMYEIENSSEKIIFSGDIQFRNLHLLRGAKPRKCDILFLEGTYSGRDHEDRNKLEKEFINDIREVLESGGKAIIAAFGVGRSQEVAMILKDQGFPLWMDGMSNEVLKIFLRHPESISSPQDLSQAKKRIKPVRALKHRMAALKDRAVISTSGMLDGGPVLWYLDRIKDDPKSTVFLTGYQVEGTNGRRLLEEGIIEDKGVEVRVNCKVKYYDFSAHAGHSELVAFAKKCRPEKVVIFHSENRAPLAEDIRDFAEVVTPENNEEMKI
jgi:putative mRNA 3-end processing factor